MSTASGEWRALVYTNGGQEVSYTAGVTTTDGSERTKEWNAGVQTTVSAGFNFLGISGQASVTGSFSRSTSSMVSRSVQESTSQTLTTSFEAPGGQVWQFAYTVQDSCGVADIKTRDLVSTANRGEPPCCLPGFAVTANRQHGPCVAGSPCTCSTRICNRPLDMSLDAGQPATPTAPGGSPLQRACGVAGVTQACICVEGSGVQSCTDAGSWSPCACKAKASRAMCLRPWRSGALLPVALLALSAAFR